MGAIPPVGSIRETPSRAGRVEREVETVAAQRTPVAPSRIRAALATAHRRLEGNSASNELLDVLTAHVSHETARGDRMFNYNFGGIKGVGPSGKTALYKTHEFVGGRKLKMTDGFRAYRSLDEGAVDYLKLMKGRYGSALERAEEGDVLGFSSALKRSRYYTAPEELYAKAMVAHVRQGIGDDGDNAYRSQVRKGGNYLFGSELASESTELGGPVAPLTSFEVARVLDSVGHMAARLGSPLEGNDDAETS